MAKTPSLRAAAQVVSVRRASSCEDSLMMCLFAMIEC